MPHHKQTAKRLRQSLELRDRNRRARSEMRTLIKKVRQSAADKSITPEEVTATLRRAHSIIDRLCKRGIIKANAASRRKSRLALLINRVNKS